MGEVRRSELNDLLASLRSSQKILRELSVTYFGYVHIDDRDNHVTAFATALKRIYSIGSNAEIVLVNTLTSLTTESFTIDAKENLSSILRVLKKILEFFSNNGQAKKTFNMKHDWKYDHGYLRDLIIFEILSEVYKVPTKIICQTEENSEKFEQSIFCAEALSKKPIIEFIVLKSNGGYKAHVLISRESEYQKHCEYAIRLKGPNHLISPRTELKIISYLMQNMFLVSDEILAMLENKVANKKNSNISTGDFVQFKRKIEKRKTENNFYDIDVPNLSSITNNPKIFEILNMKLEAECKECIGEYQLEPEYAYVIRITCGCWYHQQCLNNYLCFLIQNGYVQYTEDGEFNCRCRNPIKFKYFLSLKYCKDKGIGDYYYGNINKIKCADCFIYYPKEQISEKVTSKYQCNDCFKNENNLCGYCSRSSNANSITELFNKRICILCLIEFLFYKRFIPLKLNPTDLKLLQNQFITTNCNSCGLQAYIFANSANPQCYSCILSTLNS